MTIRRHSDNPTDPIPARPSKPDLYIGPKDLASVKFAVIKAQSSYDKALQAITDFKTEYRSTYPTASNEIHVPYFLLERARETLAYLRCCQRQRHEATVGHKFSSSKATPPPSAPASQERAKVTAVSPHVEVSVGSSTGARASTIKSTSGTRVITVHAPSDYQLAEKSAKEDSDRVLKQHVNYRIRRLLELQARTIERLKFATKDEDKQQCRRRLTSITNEIKLIRSLLPRQTPTKTGKEIKAELESSEAYRVHTSVSNILIVGIMLIGVIHAVISMGAP